MTGFRSLALLGALALVVGITSAAKAASLPITFESPTYSTGGIEGQDGWDNFFFPGTEIDVVNTNPIVGAQSLRMAGGTSSRAANSGLLGTLANNDRPTDLSYLVRIDAAGRTFESGLANDLPNTGTIFTLIFGYDGLGNNELRWYQGGSNQEPIIGNGWIVGDVYQIDWSNINYGAATADLTVTNLTANSIDVNASILFHSAPVPPTYNDTYFYVLSRGSDPNYSVTVDMVPEPSGIALLGMGFVALSALRRRTRR